MRVSVPSSKAAAVRTVRTGLRPRRRPRAREGPSPVGWDAFVDARAAAGLRPNTRPRRDLRRGQSGQAGPPPRHANGVFQTRARRRSYPPAKGLRDSASRVASSRRPRTDRNHAARKRRIHVDFLQPLQPDIARSCAAAQSSRSRRCGDARANRRRTSRIPPAGAARRNRAQKRDRSSRSPSVSTSARVSAGAARLQPPEAVELLELRHCSLSAASETLRSLRIGGDGFLEGVDERESAGAAPGRQ